MPNKTALCLAECVVLVAISRAHGEGVGYTDPEMFDAAIEDAGYTLTSVFDFDELEAGTRIPYGGSIPPDEDKSWFFYDWLYETGDWVEASGLITNLTDATSGDNSLGLNSDYERFLPGDYIEVRHDVDDPGYAVGLFVITSPFMPGGLVTLTAGDTIIANDDTPFDVLRDGREAFFLGVVSDTPFLSFSVGSKPLAGVFDYSIDDVVQYVPAPATIGLLPLMILSLLRRRRPSPEDAPPSEGAHQGGIS